MFNRLLGLKTRPSETTSLSTCLWTRKDTSIPFNSVRWRETWRFSGAEISLRSAKRVLTSLGDKKLELGLQEPCMLTKTYIC